MLKRITWAVGIGIYFSPTIYLVYRGGKLLCWW
jgi:hypothetical protein